MCRCPLVLLPLLSTPNRHGHNRKEPFTFSPSLLSLEVSVSDTSIGVRETSAHLSRNTGMVYSCSAIASLAWAWTWLSD